MKKFWLVLPFALATLSATGCKFKVFDGNQEAADEKIFWNGISEVRGAKLGIGDHQLALTLDDGPSEYTLGLARYLKHKNAHATFFMNYHNGPSFGLYKEFGIPTLKAICEMKFHTLGNHSDFHLLGKKASEGRSWENIRRVHEAFKEHCPQPYYFFRSPGGNWDGEEEAANKNGQMDVEGIPLGEQYIGPVYWDYGGQAPVADWDTKGCQSDINACRDAYVASIVKKEGRGGVVLAHDIHKATMELLMGKNWRTLLEDPTGDDRDGFIARMQAQKYTFVPLDVNEKAVDFLLKGVTPPAPPKP
jgi:peptidoglycan/xylan/chitin deacetylase (PgdA/CDA1 family)